MRELLIRMLLIVQYVYLYYLYFLHVLVRIYKCELTLMNKFRINKIAQEKKVETVTNINAQKSNQFFLNLKCTLQYSYEAL